ncbi:putative nuclease HARBI1 [Conger conger]|uniref:putative nuclease HARBI1 n=1 Tax=Conger conger TaxID=82655 RepID=UPI002A5A4805|nr:putative nuclease HARBI1 [Conger conger]
MAARQLILAGNQQRRRERSQTVFVNAFVRHHFSPLDVLSDRALQRKYRLPRSAIQHLIQLVVPQIRRATRCNYALSPEVQLLAALRFYAVGSFREVVGDGTGLSKALVLRSVAAVTPILLRHARQHIKMATTREDVRQVHQGFHAMAGIPRVLGLVDGTLIPLLNPSLVDPSWICRKHFPAVNTQVVDHDGLIVDIVARWPGSIHDSFVWANSAVGQKAGRGMFGRSIFLGDSGYPLRSDLITPVMNPASPAEEAFNEGHTHTRTHIERVFGRWKARFRCIHRSSGGLRLSPRKSCQVIVVTAMLHNIAVRAGADEPSAVDDEDHDNPPPPPLPNEPRAALHQAGLRARQEIINLF